MPRKTLSSPKVGSKKTRAAKKHATRSAVAAPKRPSLLKKIAQSIVFLAEYPRGVARRGQELGQDVIELGNTVKKTGRSLQQRVTRRNQVVRARLQEKIAALKNVHPAKKKKKNTRKKVIFDGRTRRFSVGLKKLWKKIWPWSVPTPPVKVKVKVNAKPSFGQLLYRETLGPFVYVFRRHPRITFGSLFFSISILVTAFFVYDLLFKDLPDVQVLTQRQQILTTKILDRNGQLLYRIYKDENRTLIPLSRIPGYMKQATIAIEDKEFYQHRGFSLRGIVRALKENSRNGGSKIQGGSTITQQLVKNTLLTSEKTYKRKFREILLSLLVEGTYSKDEILEMYFNEIPYGGSTYGVEEAAQRFFGKSAAQLSLAESALLAGLPQSPSVYSPFGSNPERAYARQHEVLRRMVEDKYITQSDSDQAKDEKLEFRKDKTEIKAPHFVMYIRDLLESQYGANMINQGGLEVRTTLDLSLQEQTQKIVSDEMKSLARLRISNGAALMTNPKTGEILAMVGSKDYFDFEKDGQVNVTIRPRQPGSSIKPLTYAVSLENGKNPSSTILDEPVTFHLAGSAPYSPKNYDGRFHGRVTIREALASSYNIPAVKTLAEVGISTIIDKAELMGISTWSDRKRFGLSLTLGGGEVLMTELAQVYGTFANYGETVRLNPILEVRNGRGEVLYRNACAIEQKKCSGTHTLDAKVAYQISNILSDNTARMPAFGANSVLFIPGQQVAVKTGTTNNLRDNWSFGYTEDRVVAVWVGNNDNTPMSYVASGITGASPIWNKIMRTQLDDKNPHVFPTPEGLVKVKICGRTGTLPCQGCPNVREELFVPGTEPTQACNPAFFRPRPSPAPGTNPANKPGQILDGITTEQ